MPKATSAGLLLFDNSAQELKARSNLHALDELRVLLAHPGGPYFAKKDEGAWSIPKGLVGEGENLLDAAKREFLEETGYERFTDQTEFLTLGHVKLKSGKEVYGWAFSGAWEAGRVPSSNTFEIEWPPRSGKKTELSRDRSSRNVFDRSGPSKNQRATSSLPGSAARAANLAQCRFSFDFATPLSC